MNLNDQFRPKASLPKIHEKHSIRTSVVHVTTYDSSQSKALIVSDWLIESIFNFSCAVLNFASLVFKPFLRDRLFLYICF